MDSYFAGMRDSVQAFYQSLRAGQPLPIDGAQAAEVLDWCEAIAGEALRGRTAAAAFETAPARLPAPGPARPDEVVVLGGTGFIGRRVVAKLIERGLPVTAVVRRAHSLPAAVTEAARDGRLRLVPGRLEDGEALARALQGAKTVIHLATGSGDSWEKIERSMIRGSVDVAEAALAAGVERFVYVSSIAALYAGPDCGTPVLDDSPQTDPRPEGRELYSRGKMEAERRLLALHRERGLPLVIVRPGVVLGEGTALQHSGLGFWARDNHCIGWGLGNTRCRWSTSTTSPRGWSSSPSIRATTSTARRSTSARGLRSPPARSSRRCAGRPDGTSTSTRARSGSARRWRSASGWSRRPAAGPA